MISIFVVAHQVFGLWVMCIIKPVGISDCTTNAVAFAMIDLPKHAIELVINHGPIFTRSKTTVRVSSAITIDIGIVHNGIRG